MNTARIILAFQLFRLFEKIHNKRSRLLKETHQHGGMGQAQRKQTLLQMEEEW